MQTQWNELEKDSVSSRKEPDFSFALEDPQDLQTTVDTTSTLPADSKHLERESDSEYYPFSDTIRLYAGWLLAWYGLVYILGWFQSTRSMEPAIPFVYGLLYSPLVLTCTLVAFLYLLFHSLQRTINRGYLSGTFLLLIAIVVFGLYRIHV